MLPLGDEQYNAGTAAGFAASYHPTWGRLNPISHPVVGNHEYGSPGAVPYYNYFGATAGNPGEGWYSYDVGSWHLIALNSNCAKITGGCGAGSAQEALAARRPRRPPRRLHTRLLAPPAVRLGF